MTEFIIDKLKINIMGKGEAAGHKDFLFRIGIVLQRFNPFPNDQSLEMTVLNLTKMVGISTKG